MIVALIILYLLVLAGFTAIGFLFYFLDKRQQELDRQLSLQLTQIKNEFSAAIEGVQTALENEKKLTADIPLIQENALTLRQNQDILAKDIEILLNEFKKLEKKFIREG